MAYLIGTVIQALIVFHHSDGDNAYTPEPWHGTLLMLAIILACFVFNIFYAKHLPFIEGWVFFVHVAGLIVIAVPLWGYHQGDWKSADAVFTEFANGGGWPSVGVSFLVGLLPISASLGGIDCVVHMGEFTQLRSQPV